MKNQRTASIHHWKGVFSCILSCASLAFLFSGCLFNSKPVEVPPEAETKPAFTETAPHSTEIQPEAATDSAPGEASLSSEAAVPATETQPAATTDSAPGEAPISSEAAVPVIDADVPEDAVAYQGHFYKIYFEDMDWDIARQECIKLGGHLATITDAEEQQFIEELNSDHSCLWIGGFLEDNQWRWVTEEALVYSNWGEGEPNNSSNVIPYETNIAVWPLKWNDLNNASWEQSGYICEWDGIPDVLAALSDNS